MISTPGLQVASYDRIEVAFLQALHNIFLYDAGPDRQCAEMVEPRIEFTEDALLGGRLKFRQPRRGFRVNVDAPLLAFVALGSASSIEHRAAGIASPAGRLLDIGCGVGTCGLAFLLHRPEWRGTLVEIQPDIAELARVSAAASGVARVAVIAGDILEPGVAPGPFDLILSNPPYVTPDGHQLSPNAGKNLARFELTLTLRQLQAAIKARLVPAGRAFVIVPAERAEEFTGGPLAVAARTFVHHAPGGPATWAILTLAHERAAADEENHLVIYQDAAMKRYTPELAAFLAGEMIPSRS